jgi:hypothetical protein
MDLRKNEDGSVDIHCGPKAPADRPRQKLVCVFPVLPADGDLLRPVLAVAGL